MKKCIFLSLMASILLLASCNVQERIIFNEDMGGSYRSSFDMSSIMVIASENRPASVQEEKEMKVMDTVIVFKEMLETYKDSIATLTPEKQEMLKQLENMTMHMVMNEKENVFKFDAEKTFKEFAEIEFVSYQMDEIMNIAKNTGTDKAATPGPADDMLTQEKVRYTFENNIFRRVDPVLLEKEEAESEGIDLEEEEQETGDADAMMDQMMAGFDEMLANSQMILEYTFPRTIKNVSNDMAVISEDGKSVTLAVDWKTLLDNKKFLENFEVELEE